MTRRVRAELTNADLAVRSAKRARRNRISGIVFLGLGGIYAVWFLAIGIFLGDWRLIILTAGVLLASSGFSLLSSAQRERNNAAGFQRLAQGRMR